MRPLKATQEGPSRLGSESPCGSIPSTMLGLEIQLQHFFPEANVHSPGGATAPWGNGHISGEGNKTDAEQVETEEKRGGGGG